MLALTEQIGIKISLTDAGKALQQAYCDILDTLGRFEMEVDDQKSLKTGQLRIAVVITAKYFTPRLLGKFCQLYPGINVFLEVTNREHILERMAEILMIYASSASHRSRLNWNSSLTCRIQWL